MKRIASFSVNHDKLEKGMYISRIDGDVVTYDIRMKKPNETQSGRIEYEYDIFERPTKKQSCENLYTEKEQTEILTTEKRAQLNKDKQNKDKLNKDKSNTDKENKAKEKPAPGNVENVENFSDEDDVLSLKEMRRIFDKYSGFGS